MLFFKEIIGEKLKDREFHDFYEKECHICSTTMRVVADLEERNASLDDILGQLNISKKAYDDLKEGENCDPEMVKKLCSYLGIQGPEVFKSCRKLK